MNMENLLTKVAEFNERITAVGSPPMPQRLDPDRKSWALAAFREELKEFQDAYMLEDEADAIIDLLYFGAGRLHEMGLDANKLFSLVHEANMKKKRGELSKRPGSKGHDAVKPEGWKPPDLKSHLYDMPELLILGHARHGKDTTAEMLAHIYGLSYRPTSGIILNQIIYPAIGSGYASPEDCFRDRGNRRKEWYDLIAAYNSKDEAALAKLVFTNVNMYIGMRRIKELKATHKAFPDLKVLWVERKSVGLETGGSFDYEEMAAYVHGMPDSHCRVIENNGSMMDLLAEVMNATRGGWLL